MTTTDHPPARTWDRSRPRYANLLASYHYAQTWGDDWAPLVTNPEYRVVLDSGAYSAATKGTAIDLDAYIAFTQQWREHLAWAAALDVIGNDDRSWHNWRYMTEAGVPCVPTVHYGDDTPVLDKYAEAGATLIGLGGMAAKRFRNRLAQWVFHLARHVRDNHPQVRLHAWGIRHRLLLDNVPWYSIDSSGFGGAYRYGRAQLMNPLTGRGNTTMLNGRNLHRWGRLLRDWYQVDPHDIAESHGENRPLHLYVSGRTALFTEQWMRYRHGTVPAPEEMLLTPDPQGGPHVHFAEGSVDNIHGLSRGILSWNPDDRSTLVRLEDLQ